MKRIMVLSIAVVAAAMVPAGAGHGSTDFVQTGTVLLPNPATRLYGGVTEQVSPCGGSIDPDVPAGAAQGVDGYWFALPTGAGGHDATMIATGPEPPDPVGLIPGIDVDAWFYDDGCALIRPSADPNAYHMATVGSNEFGVIPENAAWVAVDLVSGVNATFTFTVYGLPAEPR